MGARRETFAVHKFMAGQTPPWLLGTLNPPNQHHQSAQLERGSGCSGGCSDPGLSSGELNFTFLCGTAPHAPLPCWLLTACGGGKQREAVPAKGHSPPFHIQAFRVEFFSFWSSLILNPGIASPPCPWAVLGEEKLFCPSRADQGLPPLLLLSLLGQKSREGTSSTSRPGDVAAPSAPGASPS